MPKAESYGVSSVLEIVTEVFGLEGARRGDEYDMLCVNPLHNDGTPSCSVNLLTGYWNCFSCGVGGDLAKLGEYALQRDAGEVATLLRPTTPEAMLVSAQRRLARITWKPQRRKRREPLPEYPELEGHPELRVRGFTNETIEKWKFAWCEEQLLKGNKGEYTIRNSIAIPIHDAQGNNLAWCYRRTDSSPSWQPRYLYTPGVEISELWWGLLHNSRVDRIHIVEGALDAAWVDQCGYPALALLGSKMGERKIRWLQQYRSVVLLPDYDNAGAQWQQRIGGELSKRMPVYTGQYRSWMMKKRLEKDGTHKRATDPEDLVPVDLELMIETAVSFTGERVRNSLKVQLAEQRPTHLSSAVDCR